eukprot:3380486-Rhodomonas_salina.1
MHCHTLSSVSDSVFPLVPPVDLLSGSVLLLIRVFRVERSLWRTPACVQVRCVPLTLSHRASLRGLECTTPRNQTQENRKPVPFVPGMRVLVLHFAANYFYYSSWLSVQSKPVGRRL